MNSYKVSLIVPIRAISCVSNEIERLKLLVDKVNKEFEIVIVQDKCSRSVKNEIKKLKEKYCNIVVINNYSFGKRFSLSKIRNLGAKKASAQCIMFHDVDFIGSSQIYERIINYVEDIQLKSNPQNFFCIPVIFLQKKFSKYVYHELLENEKKLDPLKISQMDDEKIKFYVRGSSCIVLNKKDFRKMGGHNCKFKGHGAEDFELLHRLGERFPIADKPRDYLVNQGSGTVKKYIGFRAYFSLYGISAEEKGCILYHLWHEKRDIPKYYNHKKNFSLLEKVMKKKVEFKCVERKKIDPKKYYNCSD